jgi:hypothetical protein
MNVRRSWYLKMIFTTRGEAIKSVGKRLPKLEIVSSFAWRKNGTVMTRMRFSNEVYDSHSSAKP